jgi:hypothetical protein
VDAGPTLLTDEDEMAEMRQALPDDAMADHVLAERNRQENPQG